jgi:hypothetical protein
MLPAIQNSIKKAFTKTVIGLGYTMALGVLKLIQQ